MNRGPDTAETAELLRWIALERDAAWTAKLAILAAPGRDDIEHFGVCLREHVRHATELTALVHAVHPALDVPTDPSFLTREASVVAAQHDRNALLDAVDAIELARIARYEQRRRSEDARLEACLDVHLTDARVRLAALRRLRDVRRGIAA